jgi:DNA-binding NarL/FixJ family response regulator
LADDHVVVRSGIKRIIEDEPDLKVVAQVGDGLELISVLQQIPADIVILDITMPNLSGIEALKKIKQLFPHLKVLMLTMHKSQELIQLVIAAGTDGYLLKEDAPQELISAIRSLRDGHTYISRLLFPLFEEHCIRSHRDGYTAPEAESLTCREIEIVKLIAEGRSSKEIANILCLSYRTIQNHRTRIMRKLSIKKSIDLVRYAINRGFMST